ncbi:MAG TPA: hydrogenase 2 operon protein HybA [Terriglobales bacterium]|nr:hydrogenase 2 operon protein HybA [Terriglobales bacterium]
MDITRREVITKIAKTGATGAVAVTVGTHAVREEGESIPIPSTAVGLLYDATICIGCKACVAACAEANDTPPDTRLDGLHQGPDDLNDVTRNIIKLYKPTDGTPSSYVKRQCMHCLDPACAAGCPFQALAKDPETGIVSWTADKCIGCRYCTITCPYHVPRFQWMGYNPRVTKCELCSTRLERGLKPGCTTVCPTGAVIFGARTVLLAEGKRRIKENPGRYYENKVYGETDNGGTQSLYLARVPFEDLGLPEIGPESVPAKTLRWQRRFYQYFALPALLYAGLVQVIRKSVKGHVQDAHDHEKETGLRAQL